MEKKGFKSYAQLSQQLGMNAGAIFNIMSKGVTPSDELCKKMADLAGDPVEKVLILAAESRAPESTRPAWEKLLKTAAKAGLFTLGLGVLYLTGHDQNTLPFMGLALGSLRTVDIMSSTIPLAITTAVLMYRLKKSAEPSILSI